MIKKRFSPAAFPFASLRACFAFAALVASALACGLSDFMNPNVGADATQAEERRRDVQLTQIAQTATAIALSATPTLTLTPTPTVIPVTPTPGGFFDQLSDGLPALAYTSNRDGNWEIYAQVISGALSIESTTINSLPIRLTYSLATEDHPVVSPDGKSMLFARAGNGTFDISLMSLDSSTVVTVTNSLADKWPYDWASINGGEIGEDKVLVVSNETGLYQIHAMSLDGADVIQLADTEGPKACPTYLPNGGGVVFKGGNDLYLINVDGSNQRQLTTGSYGCPASSPDGQFIVAPKLVGEQWDLYSINLVTGEETPLTDDAAFESSADFSPDGNWLAFDSNRDGPFNIWLLNLASGHQIQVTDQGDNRSPKWFVLPDLSALVPPPPVALPDVRTDTFYDPSGDLFVCDATTPATAGVDLGLTEFARFVVTDTVKIDVYLRGPLDGPLSNIAPFSVGLDLRGAGDERRSFFWENQGDDKWRAAEFDPQTRQITADSRAGTLAPDLTFSAPSGLTMGFVSGERPFVFFEIPPALQTDPILGIRPWSRDNQNNCDTAGPYRLSSDLLR
jgi:Tol biopolymer transport system component